MTKKPEIATLEINAADLAGMLADLERTASRDQCLPMLRGVVLHAEKPNGGDNRLYGTSTNRFILGTAWEPIIGSLPTAFLDLDAVALLRRILAYAAKGATAVLTYHRVKDGDDEIQAEVNDLTSVRFLVRRLEFPDAAGLVAKYDQPSSGEAVLSPDYVSALAQIGRRRRARLRFRFGTGKAASTIDIGNRYRAMLMPVLEPADDEYRWSLPAARSGDYA